MKAIVVGATGATGKDLVNILLNDSNFSQVTIFVRKDTGLKHPKLVTHSIDFEKIDTWRNLVQGDVLFSCLGTTLKAAGSKEAQWKIDYDYQYNFAQVAKENGVFQYVLVSSVGANSKSSFFYMKMKGALEEAVKTLNFERLVLLNPPALIRKGSDRAGESINLKVIQFLNTLGLFRSQKPMLTETLAEAMVKLAKSSEKGIFKLSPKEIFKV